MNRKKIYILNDFYSSSKNGIGTFVKTFISLMKKEYDIHVFEFNSKTDHFYQQSEYGVNKYYFPFFPTPNFLEYNKIINIFCRLYIEDSKDAFFVLNYSPCKNLIESIKKTHPLSNLIFIVHDLSWTSTLLGDVEKFERIVRQRNKPQLQDNFKKLIAWFEDEKQMFQMVDKLVVLSEDTMNLLTNTYSIKKEKLSLIYNAIDRKKYSVPQNGLSNKTNQRKKKFIKPDEKLLLYVGRVSKAKGIDILLQALKRVLVSEPLCKLVVIGSVHDFSTFSAHLKSIANQVIFTGHLPKKEILDWYSIADIGVIPSYSEQCSYTGLEMMHYGIPIVTSDAFGLRNMFKDQENSCIGCIDRKKKSFLFAANIATAIEILLRQDDLRCKFIEKNYFLLEDKYALNHMKEKYQLLLK